MAPIFQEMINRRDRCNWANLPKDFEMEAVRAAFRDIKPFFGRNDIKARIAASKALTFVELREAIRDAL